MTAPPELFATDKLLPHGTCLLWDKKILTLHVLSDSVISIAYFCIPVLLIYIFRMRRDLIPPPILFLFAAFILFCGTTHLMDIWILWHPDYVTQGVLKALTALSSLSTVIYLGTNHRRFLSFPSQLQLQALNQQLHLRVFAHEQTNASLKAEVRSHTLLRSRYEDLNRNLEKRVQERTFELQSITEKLRRSEEDLKLSLEGGNLGSWWLDMAIQSGEISETLSKMFGLASYGHLQFDEFLNIVHPDDREHVSQSIRKSIENGSDYECEFRVIWPDGSTHWINGKGQVYANENNVADSRILRGVCRDITEIKAIAFERTKYLNQLEDSDRQKDEFIALMAHELRNPLAPLSLASHLLQNGNLNQEQLTWSYQSIGRQVNHLTRLVDDLLDISRINLGSLNLDKKVIDLRSVLSTAVEFSLPRIENANLKLLTSYPDETLFIKGDHVRLTQAIANILNNAAKFTPSGGRISLEVKHESDHVLILIKDTGIGIDAASLDHVFDLFVTFKTSLPTQNDGLGIGLYLTKRLIVMHEGLIEVKSDGIGCGSEFILRLPLQKETSISEPSNNPILNPVTSRKVLVVDDNNDAADSIKILLEFKGCEVKAAYDGELAIEIAQSFRPDIVILDLGMPVMDGYETCRRLRQYPWGKGITIVALSGWGQDSDKKKALETGFNQHFIKPFQLEDLEILLNQP